MQHKYKIDQNIIDVDFFLIDSHEDVLRDVNADVFYGAFVKKVSSEKINNQE